MLNKSTNFASDKFVLVVQICEHNT